MPDRSFVALGAGVCFCLCAPVVCAQQPDVASREARATVSVRELSIPESARNNYAKSRAELVEKGKPACAITHLHQAIDTYPDYYEAWFLLGVAHLELKQTEEAEAALRKSVSLSAGRFVQPLIALATLFSNQARFSEAEEFATQAVDLDDSMWYAHYELGRARFKLGSYAEALPSARIVVREQPEYPRGRLLLALIHAQLQQYDRGLPHLDAYLQLAPSAPDHARMTALRAQMARAADSMQTASAGSHPD